VTAVVEYNYQRNGEILIPAGSRAIGKIDGADRNGNVSISFSTIDLPDGSPVPISTVAVDSNLRTIKGVVTGSNRGKGIIVGTLSGIGSAAAMLVGQSSSSMSAAYSQNDVIRDRLAQNAGSMGDSQVNRLIANEHIVVTVPAGTELYMVFTKAAVAAKSNTSTASNAGTGSSTTAPSLGFNR
jgi:alanine dehydrogenase